MIQKKDYVIKWHAEVKKIDENKLIVDAIELYPIRGIKKFETIIPIIGNENFNTGDCFYIYVKNESVVFEKISKCDN